MLEADNIWNLFDTYNFGTEVASGKPAPDIFLEAQNKAKLKKEELLILEDSQAGILAAHQAQILVICIFDVKKPKAEILVYTAAVYPRLDYVIKLSW